MKKILITGGSGLIGNSLANYLKNKGLEIKILSRNPEKIRNFEAYKIDFENNKIDYKAVEDIDAIIHLAGANISRRWTKLYKEEILDSRVRTAHLLYDALISTGNSIEFFLSASAIGYYGTKTTDKIFTEEDPAGDDFLANVCRYWEIAAKDFESLRAKVAIVRIGVVLGKNGGLLKKLLPLAKARMLSSLGSGRQFVPWIHIDDIVGIFDFILEKQLSDTYNGVAPEFSTMNDLVKTIYQVLGKKPLVPKIPTFAVKALYGEMSSLILEGSRISPGKIINAGYEFKFKTLKNALENLLKQTDNQ